MSTLDDQRILQYIGKVVTEMEVEMRESRYRLEGKRSEYLVKITTNGLWTDPTYVGIRSCYVNHSCSRNAVSEEIALEGTKVRLMVNKTTKNEEAGLERFIDHGWDSL